MVQIKNLGKSLSSLTPRNLKTRATLRPVILAKIATLKTIKRTTLNSLMPKARHQNHNKMIWLNPIHTTTLRVCLITLRWWLFNNLHPYRLYLWCKLPYYLLKSNRKRIIKQRALRPNPNQRARPRTSESSPNRSLMCRPSKKKRSRCLWNHICKNLWITKFQP